MTATGCTHPEADVSTVSVSINGIPRAEWCSVCGSIRYRNGPWQAPTGLVLPGWTCPNCRAFNGGGKATLTECRACGTKKICLSG